MEPRHWTNKVLEILEQTEVVSPATLSLLNYLSDDDVYDWAICNGYLDVDDEDDS